MDPLTQDHIEMSDDDEIEDVERADEEERREPSARELFYEAVDRGNMDYI